MTIVYSYIEPVSIALNKYWRFINYATLTPRYTPVNNVVDWNMDQNNFTELREKTMQHAEDMSAMNGELANMSMSDPNNLDNLMEM